MTFFRDCGPFFEANDRCCQRDFALPSQLRMQSDPISIVGAISVDVSYC
jgi:hypothetical protein